MAYRAEIEIGVKGASRLKELQDRLTKLSRAVEDVNVQTIVDNSAVQSVNEYSRALSKAAKTLNETAIQIDKNGNAIGNYRENIRAYVTALGQANEAQEITNRLTKQEIDVRTQATAALKAYNAAAAAPTQRGAQTTMAGAYLRGQPSFDPELPPDFNPVAAAGRARASGLAAEAIKKGQGAQEAIRIINEVTEYQRRAFIDITNNKIQLTQKQLDAELDNIEKTLNAALKADKVKQADWDRRFKLREEATEQLADQRKKDEVRIANIRKEAAKSIETLEKKAADKRRARAKQRKEAAGSAIIGGAFPLLFGQGPGAAIGGGLGGGLGGAIGGQFGFGLSLVGTQLGTIVDQTIQNISVLGAALNPLTADLGKIAEAAGYAGTETESYIKAIEQNAGTQAALAAATEQLNLLVGKEGVEALKQFGEATQDLGNSWNQVMTQMGADLAKLLKDSTQGLADAISDSAALQAGLRQTTGTIGTKAQEFQALRARSGKVTSGQQLKDNQRLRDLRAEIIGLVRQERAELQKNLQATKAQFDLLEKIKIQETQAQTQLSILSITEQASKSSNEASEIRKQTIELVAAKEKQIESLRLSLESEVASIRLSNLRKENSIRDTEERLQIARLKNDLREASSAFTSSLRLDAPGREFAETISRAGNQFIISIAKADAERNKTNRDAALELESLKLKAEQTRARIAKRSSEIQVQTTAKAAEIQTKANEFDAQLNKDKFTVEKTITKLQLDRIEIETNLLRLRLETDKTITTNSKEYFARIASLLKDARKTIDESTAPEAIGKLDIDTSAGVSTAGFDQVITDAAILIGTFRDLRNQITDEALREASQILTTNLQSQTAALLEQETPLEQRRRTLQATAEETRLIAEGFSKVDAAAIVKGNEAFANQIETLTTSRDLLQNYVTQFENLKVQTPEVQDTIVAFTDEIAKLDKRLNQTKTQAGTFINSFEQTSKITEYIKQLNAQLVDTEAMAIRVADGIGNAVGTALDSAISGLIEGSATVQEVFANMLKSIGQILVQEGTKMIATYIAIGIAKAFAGMGSSTPKIGTDTNYFSQDFTPMNFFKPRANGGPVSPNSTYMVGENGPELFRPTQAGRIDSNSDLRSAMSRQRSNAPAMNFSFETTNIGGTEYVSREQLEAAMAVTRRQAANDGAKRGMNMTLDKMQHSPSTRRRVGI